MSLGAKDEIFSGKAWDDLANLNGRFADKVKSEFPNLGTFCLSVVDEADATALVQCVMTGILKQEEVHKLASGLWAWCLRYRSLQGHLIRSIRAAVESGPYVKALPRPDAAETFQGLVNNNLLLGLSVLERQLKQNKQLRTTVNKQA